MPLESSTIGSVIGGDSDTSPATDWLKSKIQQHGKLHAPKELIQMATGKAPSEGPLLDYLDAKFGAIYGV